MHADPLPLVLALLTLAVVAPRPAPLAPPAVAAQQRTPVNVGFVSYTALSWPFWAAQAIGSFEQEGLAVDIAALGSAPQVTAALVGGSIDVGDLADIHIRR